MPLTGDSGTARLPTARGYVFGGAPPVLASTGDAGVSTTPTARTGVWQPAGFDSSAVPVTNPPSATSDIGAS